VCRFLQQLLSWMEESEGRDGAERKNIVNTAPFSELPFLVSQGQQLWFC
jgi:hypothetical protein